MRLGRRAMNDSAGRHRPAGRGPAHAFRAGRPGREIGRRRQLRRRARRDRGGRRRIRVGQVGHQPLDHAAALAAGRHRRRRASSTAPATARCSTSRRLSERAMRARPRPRDRDDLPGADDQPQPALHGRRPDHRDDPRCTSALRAREARRARAGRMLELVEIPARRAAARRLSAPDVRRHAPARDDRAGARPAIRAADRRRADDRARRHHPGADPRPAAPPAGTSSACASCSSRTISASSPRSRTTSSVMYAGRVVEAGAGRRRSSSTSSIPIRRACWPAFRRRPRPRARRASACGSSRSPARAERDRAAARLRLRAALRLPDRRAAGTCRRSRRARPAASQPLLEACRAMSGADTAPAASRA